MELCLLKSCSTRTLADLGTTTPCPVRSSRKPFFHLKLFVTESCILEDAAKPLLTGQEGILKASGILEQSLLVIPDRHCIPGSFELGRGIYKTQQRKRCSSDHLPFRLSRYQAAPCNETITAPNTRAEVTFYLASALRDPTEPLPPN